MISQISNKKPIHTIDYFNKRNIFFISLSVIALLMIYSPLKDILWSSVNKDYYSHIILIPIVSGGLIYWRRKKIFTKLEYSYRSGITLLAIGGALYFIAGAQEYQLNKNDYSSLITFSGIIFWTGGVVLLYGAKAFRAAAFPILFLVFMIPIPSALMDRTIFLLQAGSAEAPN